MSNWLYENTNALIGLVGVLLGSIVTLLASKYARRSEERRWLTKPQLEFYYKTISRLHSSLIKIHDIQHCDFSKKNPSLSQLEHIVSIFMNSFSEAEYLLSKDELAALCDYENKFFDYIHGTQTKKNKMTKELVNSYLKAKKILSDKLNTSQFKRYVNGIDI